MIRKKARTWTTLVLILALALAGCGSRPSDSADKEQLSAPVYIPQSLPCQLPIQSVTACCAVDGTLYVAGTLPEENGSEEDGWSFSSSPAGEGEGEAFTNVPQTGRPALFRVNPETGGVEEIPGYAPVPAAEDGHVRITAMAPGGDGTLWVLEETLVDQESGNAIDVGGDTVRFLTSEAAARRWRRLDGVGGELDSLDVTALAGRLGEEEVSGTLMDTAGRLWAVAGGTLTVLDGGGQPLFSQKDQSLTGALVCLGDGGVGARTETGTVRTADLETGSWGPELPLPGSPGRLFAGSGDALLLCTAGDSLYRYTAESGAGARMLSWSGAGVDPSQVRGLALLPESQAAVLLERQDGGEAAFELVLLSPADQEALASRTVLTLATMGLDSETRAKVLDFNRTSAACRIQVQDYSEFNTGDDPTAGLTRLQTELAAGRMPDLLDVSEDSIPLRQYAARGLLEDLWPYIDADPELGRERLMDRPLQAASLGGKLYQVFSSFSIETAAGAVSAVGDRMGWTLAELREALAGMPAGCDVLGPEDTGASLFETLTAQNLDHWIDWEAGTADFTGQDFLDLLDFCAALPREAESGETDDAYSRAARGEQLLVPEYLGDFYALQLYRSAFNGEAALVGYPSQSGCGSSFRTSGGLAMSSACQDKEGAWSFLRRQLLPGSSEAFGVFPVNRADFEKMAEECMHPEYALDENGFPITGADGEPLLAATAVWIVNGQVIMMEAVSQADYDRVMALYNRVDTLSGRDERVWDIVRESTLAFFAGDRTAQETARAIQSRVELYLNELR